MVDVRNLDGMEQAAAQALPDPACAPSEVLPPGAPNGCSLRRRELVGVAEGPPRSMTQPFPSTLLVVLKIDTAPAREIPARGTAQPSFRRRAASQHMCSSHHRKLLPSHLLSAPSGRKVYTHLSCFDERRIFRADAFQTFIAEESLFF